MLILVDVSVGDAVTRALRQAGHDVASVTEIDARMSDSTILQRAMTEQRLVLTMDKDFGELVYRSGAAHAGVLLLRLEQADAAEKVRVTGQIFQAHAGQLAGRFSVYQGGRLRIR